MRSYLAALLVLHATAASAQLSELCGYTLGTTLDSLQTRRELSCRPVHETYAQVVCERRDAANYRIGDVSAASCVLYIAQQRLIAIEAQVDEAQFARLVDVLQQQHGKVAEQIGRLRAGMGAAFDNRVLSWKSGAVTLHAEQFYKKIDRSVLFLGEDAAVAALTKPKQFDPVSGVKDL